MKGKIITCCGDCVYYDWKKHKCKNGYNKQDNPQDHFYDDCNVFKDLEEYDKEIYNKAIDEAMIASAKAICIGCGYRNGTKCTYTGRNCSVSKPMLETVMKALEQLKAGGESGTDN